MIAETSLEGPQGKPEAAVESNARANSPSTTTLLAYTPSISCAFHQLEYYQYKPYRYRCVNCGKLLKIASGIKPRG